MKIIDLLNKIANGEEVPEIIKYEGDILKYDRGIQDYKGISRTGSGSFFNYLFVNKSTSLFINNEVEIIENNKKEIDPVNAYKLMESPYMANQLKLSNYYKFMDLLKQSELELVDKINELIDEVNIIKNSERK